MRALVGILVVLVSIGLHQTIGGRSLPDKDLRVLLSTAREMNLDEDETILLLAIRLHENGAPGRECGVLYRMNGEALKPYTFWPLSLQENAALCSIKIKTIYTGKLNRDLAAFAEWYAPIGAKNDPTGLNRNWLPLVRKYIKQLKEERKMTTRCKDKGCGAEIEFVNNPKTGKKIPVEPKKVWILTDDGKMVKGKVCHFSTCPGADTFRKRTKQRPEQEGAK